MDFIGLAFGLAVSALLLRLAIALWRREYKPRARHPGGHYSFRNRRIEIQQARPHGTEER